MVIRGKVKGGKVILADPKALKEGTEVEVRPVKRAAKAATKKPKNANLRRKRPRHGDQRRNLKKKNTPGRGWLMEALRPYIGIAKDLPPDMSKNLDHYLYGHPKQE
jgi:hypothetical protein